MDLAANSHTSAKSRRANFSSSTGNFTNRSVNTKQFAIAHKSCALKLAMEKKWAAQLEYKNRDMASCLQELEAMVASGNTRTIPPKVPPAPPARHSIQIAGAEFAHSAVGNLDDSFSDENSSDPYIQIIIPHCAKKLPAQPVPRVPSKTSLPTPKNQAGDRHALDGDY
jgi:hypothetical protein